MQFNRSNEITTLRQFMQTLEAMKNFMQRFIEQENAKQPLSDIQITGLLKNKGISIARRTVAKYREQLGILTAQLRKVL